MIEKESSVNLNLGEDQEEEEVEEDEDSEESSDIIDFQDDEVNDIQDQAQNTNQNKDNKFPLDSNTNLQPENLGKNLKEDPNNKVNNNQVSNLINSEVDSNSDNQGVSKHPDNVHNQNKNEISQMNQVKEESSFSKDNSQNRHIKNNNEMKDTEAMNQTEDNRKVTFDSPESHTKKTNFEKLTNQKNKEPEKSVFTRISEEIYNKYVSNKSQHYKKTSAYDFMINDHFLSRIVERNDKNSHQKFQRFFNRNKEFRDKKMLNLQDKTQKLSDEIKNTCTGTPNNRVFDKTEVRDPNEFMSDQLKYLESRELNIKKQQEDIIKQTDSKCRDAPEISEKSRKLAEKRTNNEKEVHSRLFNEKIHNEKKNLLKGNDSVNTNGEKKRKKTQQEIKELSDKLYSEAEQFKENKAKLVKEKFDEFHHLWNSDDELTDKKSKIQILQKFIENFNSTIEKNFGSLEEKLDFNQFQIILLELGFTRNLKPSLDNEEINKSFFSQQENSIEQAWKIIKANSENAEKVDPNLILVFLSISMGLYKGQDNDKEENNIEEEEIDVDTKKRKESPNSKKKPFRVSFSIERKSHFPEIPKIFRASITKKKTLNKNPLNSVLANVDFSQYRFPKKTAKTIKHLFRLFYFNRMEFIYESKKAARIQKMQNQEVKISAPERKNTSPKKNFKIDPLSRLTREKNLENDLIKLKKEIEEKEISECTFQPNVHKQVEKKNIKQTIENLYQDGVNKLKQKKNQTIVETEVNSFTFAPHVNPYRAQVFKENKMINKELVEKEVKRIEKARLERKILEAQKKKGIYNLKGLKNVDALLDDEELPSFNHSLERKFLKETIDSFNRSQIIKSETKSDFFKTYKNTRTSFGEPLLNIEVNIDDKNTVEKLEIFSNDDPVMVARNFCEKYGLGEDKKMRLQKIIEEKLSENFGNTK